MNEQEEERWLTTTALDCREIVEAYFLEVEGVEVDLLDDFRNLGNVDNWEQSWLKVGDGFAALDKIRRLDIITSDDVGDGFAGHVGIALGDTRIAYVLSARVVGTAFCGFQIPAWSMQGIRAVYRHRSLQRCGS